MGGDQNHELLADVRAPYPFRVHQQAALDALRVAVGQGRDRAWLVLPPGAGKTLVGLETVRRLGRRAVVFGPNSAIQSQWLADWAEFLPAPDHPAWSGDGRDLSSFVTALTYQSLATFDPDNEVDEEGAEQPLLTRLHPNGLALVEAMQAAGPLTLVLDECHHLLQVWGRLLAEVLDQLPDAIVLGLTATPAESLTGGEAALVDALFGEPVYRTSIPAVVREGDLAPFAELAWLTTPTPTEQAWVSDEANRFGKLVHDLTDPSYGSIGFFEWLDRRFVVPVGTDVSWHELTAAEPELCTAALRMHRAGYLALPDGARLTEQHRHEPTADDWVLLVDDWMRRHLTQSTSPDDQEVVAAVRRVLPSVGYRWTRHGIRKGRSPVDRVLARSAAKTDAVPTIVAAEHRAIGDRLRMLVLCDHERATATLPADLDGVLAPQAGAALLVLDRLLVDPQTRDLKPMLVSGSTVAGSPETLAALVEQVRRDDPRLADQLGVVPGNDAAATLDGPWTSRRWVGLVTRFFEAGGCRVLVGTRGLLGEGWDAKTVTGLVDLTAATTPTAVVQTRGRTLRVDPAWPDKVALVWTVTCLSEDHPKGDNDWQRFVRKHTGYFGVDEDGSIVDGVAHIDPRFSPYFPPPLDDMHETNARMLVRAERRADIAALWRVGEPYDDVVSQVARIQERQPGTVDGDVAEPTVVPGQRGLDVRDGRAGPWRPHPVVALALLAGVLGALLGLGPSTAGLLTLAAAMGIQLGVASFRGRELARSAARRPSIHQIGCAVADGLQAADLSPEGADAVRVSIGATGEYRCSLTGVGQAVSECFASAVDEVVSPIAAPRYVLPRWVVDAPAAGPSGLVTGLAAATGLLRPAGEVWHPVPTALGTRADRAQGFAAAWDRRVGGGKAVYTGSPRGEGVLVTHRGSDPFALTTVLRVHWR